MQKIPTIFQRSPDRRRVIDEPMPGCEWVFAGEGVATRKWDGTCVMFDGDWWFRREVKPSKEPPKGWVELGVDEVTEKRVGWEPARPDSSFIVMLREAIDNTFEFGSDIPHDTYELCGPKINGNTEAFGTHVLVRHGVDVIDEDLLDVRSFDALAANLPACEMEGIVWHHPDGRMAKIKRRDFPAIDDGS